MKRDLPIPAIVALAVLVAGGIGIWRGLSQPAPESPPGTSPVELAPLEAPKPSASTATETVSTVLAGTVLMPDGSPAAQAKVYAQPTAWVGKPSLQAPTVPKDLEIGTDDRGHFSLEVSLDWSWTLRATKDRLAGVKLDAMAPDTNLVIQLAGSQEVRVTVREATGAVLSSIPVGLTGEGQSSAGFEAVTDGSGRAVFPAVPQGKWRADAVENVQSKAATGRPIFVERRRASAGFEVVASAPSEVVLELQAVGKIRGKVTAPAGTELAQLIVFSVPFAMSRAVMGQEYAAQMIELPQSYPSAKVGADGRFELTDVSGPQGLVVPHPALVHPQVRAEPDGAEVTVALAKDKVLKGRVVDAAGKPLSRFAINGAEYNSPDGSFEYRGWGPVGTERPKNLPLIVTADGYVPLETRVELGAGDTDVGALQMQAGRTFVLTLLDEQTGAPVDDAHFARLEGNALSSEPAEVVKPGVYRFSRLPSEDTTLSITRYGGAVRKLKVGATETEKTYRFGAGATVKGQVLGPNGKPAVGARVFPSGELRSTRLTDGEGRFSFTGLEPGEITLVVMFGRSTAIKKVAVPASGEVELKIEMAAAP